MLTAFEIQGARLFQRRPWPRLGIEIAQLTWPEPQQEGYQGCGGVAHAEYCDATGIYFYSSQSWCAALLFLRIARSREHP